jgi:hypothetical protein
VAEFILFLLVSCFKLFGEVTELVSNVRNIKRAEYYRLSEGLRRLDMRGRV